MTPLNLAFLVWDPALGYISGPLVMACIFFLLFLSYRRITERYSGREAVMLFTPRVAVALLLILLLLDPKWAVTQRVEEDLRFLFLNDGSASMEVADRDDSTRSKRAKTVMKRLREQLPEHAEVDERRFSSQMLDGDTEGVDADAPNGTPRTDIAQVLVDVEQTSRARNWDGAVLFTDGGDERFRVGNPPSMPIYFYVTGAEAGKHNDVAINTVDAPTSVQKGAKFTVQTGLKAFGETSFLDSLSGLNITLQIRHEKESDWRTIQQNEISLRDGEQASSMTVDGLERNGRHTMRVAVEPVSDELTKLNNERYVPVNVKDTELKVLLFSSSPGQNEMILRRALEEDSGISVTALIRLRKDRYMVRGEDENTGDDGPSLEEGFPSSAGELDQYDVVVVGSFPAKMWKQQQMDALAAFVEEGGGAVFLGGEESFGRGGYADTPLAPLIPWRIDEGEPEMTLGRRGVTVSSSVVRKQFISGLKEKLSAAHPLYIYSLNRPGKLRRGALGLLTAAAEEGEVPVLAVQTYGQGRVMGAATDTLWRWRTAGDAKKDAYDHLWRKGFRYLSGTGQGGGMLRVEFDRPHYYPGETAEIDVTVAGDYAEGALRMEALRSGVEEEEYLGLERRPDSANRFRTTTTFSQRGTHQFQFSAYLDNEELDTFETSTVVGAQMNEGARIYPDFEFLHDTASEVGGDVFREGKEEKLRDRLKEHTERSETSRMEPLVQFKGIYLVFMLLILAAEWIIRRRMNLF